ncbi:complex I intermediate-associated protein-like protein CIA30 [Patellaria atrata CBS 101060]|uniref:Complex I intermediate-associated protein-like protein CIA30 n=1 Tax=Patellaria atrata CBS 101060 TaxID=1346257 RepID=A0A9P4VPP8_9PEZI|nr:complex I intermediate-associated protein-like protein CIA30 [Patellaria atrata CBS 101060]
MHCTARCFAPGFLKRSLEEFKRLSGTALRFETVSIPTRPYQLITFSDPDSITRCKAMSDADIGGFSHAQIDYVSGSETEPPHLRFHGNISIELPKNRPNLQRSGYAGWRTLYRGSTVFGRSLWDIDPYTYLAMRIKSDGRKYFVNLQTESIVPTDLHQHRLYTRKPGEWETILINWNDFVRTNHGEVVEPQMELLRQRVRTIGVSLIDRTPGAFDLSVSRIWATNGLSEQDAQEDDWSKDFPSSSKSLKPEKH